MAYIVMANIVMAYIVVAYIVMARMQTLSTKLGACLPISATQSVRFMLLGDAPTC